MVSTYMHTMMMMRISFYIAHIGKNSFININIIVVAHEMMSEEKNEGEINF